MHTKYRYRTTCYWLMIACAVAICLDARGALGQEVVGPAGGDPAISAPITAPATSTNPQKLGEAPEDNSHQFLREDSILLKPGQLQFDIGLNYTLVDHHFTTVGEPGDVLLDTRDRRRLLVMPLDLRLGISDRLQAFIDLPVGWTNTEISAIGEDDFSNQGGLGDLNTGFSYLLHKSCGWSCDPDIITTFGMTAPTGNGNFLAGLFEAPQTTLGQGFWAGYWNILFVHTYDPIIVFYGLGSRHELSRNIDGIFVEPGAQFNYRAGVGFAVNEHVTLSTSLYGSYIVEPRLDGQRLQGDILEPVYMRFAVTMAQCNRICEPFAEIGLTSDAANARFGVTWTF